MGEVVTSAIMEIAVAVVGLVVAVVVGILGRAAKSLMESKARREAATALESFDSVLYDAAVRAGQLAEERVASEVEEFRTFGDNDRYDLVRRTMLDTINDLSIKAGFNTRMSEAQFEALIVTGVTEGRRVWRENTGGATAAGYGSPNTLYRVPGHRDDADAAMG